MLNDDENPVKPLSIASLRDFEEISHNMENIFDGKETEQNWDKRRKAMVLMSRVTHGNAPAEYRSPYVSFMKSQLDGILKTVDSLRTNVSSSGLNLLQHIASRLGQGVDFMVEFVSDTLLARSCNTNKVKRDSAIITFATILRNATCNRVLVKHVVTASEHKDPNARTAVATWLNALMLAKGRHCDQVGVLDLIEKCIKNGLNDPKPQVRTPMRETYGIFAGLWPERADRLRTTLDAKVQKTLDDLAMPEPLKDAPTRPSIRDIKAAKKKELEAQQTARSESVQSNRPSPKDIEGQQTARPESVQSDRPPLKEIKASKTRDTETKKVHPPPGLARQPSSHANQPPGHTRQSSSHTHQPSGHARHPSSKDAKVPKKRDGDAAEVAQPPPAEPLRTSTRDTKTAKKRDGENMAPILSTSFNDTTKKGDTEHKDARRLMSSHMHTHPTEKKFHILSSAPMRPQRGLVDTKRATANPAAGLHQQPEGETPNHRQSALPAANIAPARLRPSAGRSGPQVARVVTKDTVPKPAVRKMSDPKPAVREMSDPKPPVRKMSDPKPPVRKISGASAERCQEGSPNPPRVTKRRSAEAVEGLQRRGRSRSSSFTSASSPTVLREIAQLNETLKPDAKEQNMRLKYKSTETAERNRCISPTNQTPEKARIQLHQAIDKIRARSMDDLGYRRLQGLIKMHDRLFQDETKYDDLILALFEALETPNTERRVPLGHKFENKFQILVTIRMMLVHNKKYCNAYYPRALSALITARGNFESRCHIVGGLEETADDIVRACSPPDVIDTVLDMLDLQEHDDAGYRALSLGIQILGGLVNRMPGSEIADKMQEQRLTQFALKSLRNENSETRRATITFCVELHRLIHPEKKYFFLVAGHDEALKSLLTYFITTSHRK